MGRAERKAAVGAQEAMQPFEVDVRIFQGDHEVNRVLFVTQKKILRMPSGDLPTKASRLLDREKGRMLDRRIGNAKGIERGEELIGAAGHRCNISRSRGLLSARPSWR